MQEELMRLTPPEIAADKSVQNPATTQISADKSVQDSATTQIATDKTMQNPTATQIITDKSVQNPLTTQISADKSVQNSPITRYLALDIGDKTIGLAVSDLLGLTAQGLQTLRRKSIKEDLKSLDELITAYEVKAFVIGLPKNMNGTEGERCVKVREFAAKISKAFSNLEIHFCDERLSTVAAEKSLIAADVSRRKRKKVIDKMAAVHILQGFLDGLNIRFESSNLKPT